MTSATTAYDELTVPDSLEQLLREPDPAAASAPHDAPAAPSPRGPAADLGGYLAYAGSFVGAGLVSGGLVHLPLDRSRYLALALVGAAVFLAATVVQEVGRAAVRPTRARLARIMSGSLLLSLGIGMLSGGVQHFTDFPQRGAVLVPLGLAVSFLGFAVRAGCRPRALLSRSAAVVAVAALLAFAGLQWVAGTASSGSTSGHGHGHGPAPAVAHAPAAETAPSPPPPASQGLDDAELQRQLDELEDRLAEVQEASRS